MYLDGKSAILSSLFENVPEVNPPKVIPDPTHQKPIDWIDEEFMDDPSDKKPEDWDETQPLEIPDDTRKKPLNWSEETEEWIPDPKARKPSEWNDEEDGDWVAPMIRKFPPSSLSSLEFLFTSFFHFQLTLSVIFMVVGNGYHPIDPILLIVASGVLGRFQTLVTKVFGFKEPFPILISSKTYTYITSNLQS
jgi:hypothetical protein